MSYGGGVGCFWNIGGGNRTNELRGKSDSRLFSLILVVFPIWQIGWASREKQNHGEIICAHF